MKKTLPLAALLVGLAGVLFATLAGAEGPAEQRAGLTRKVILPAIARDGVPPPPTPTPEPPPYQGAVVALSLPSAGLEEGKYIEPRHTFLDNGRERLQEPSHPAYIAWYNQLGHPGYRAGNTIFSAHVDYVGYGRGPFWGLHTARVGDTLTVVMDNGLEYSYTVQWARIIHLSELDMNEVVYPALDSHRERITLISCGGTFIPYPGGGGEYDSRVVLIAERIHP